MPYYGVGAILRMELSSSMNNHFMGKLSDAYSIKLVFFFKTTYFSITFEFFSSLCS